MNVEFLGNSHPTLPLVMAFHPHPCYQNHTFNNHKFLNQSNVKKNLPQLVQNLEMMHPVPGANPFQKKHWSSTKKRSQQSKLPCQIVLQNKIQEKPGEVSHGRVKDAP